MVGRFGFPAKIVFFNQQLIREAIEFHIEAMREDGLPVPEPASTAEYVEVALA